MSLENQSVKSEKESKSSGMMKWSSAHSSAMLFWIGVPAYQPQVNSPIKSRQLRKVVYEESGYRCSRGVDRMGFVVPGLGLRVSGFGSGV